MAAWNTPGDGVETLSFLSSNQNTNIGKRLIHSSTSLQLRMTARINAVLPITIDRTLLLIQLSFRVKALRFSDQGCD
jgi:hypothetical protein